MNAHRASSSSDVRQEQVVKLESGTSTLPVACQCVFWHNTADLDSEIPYQIQIRSAALHAVSDSTEIVVQAMEMHWSDGRKHQSLAHDANSESGSIIELGENKARSEDVKANLRLLNETLVISGVITSQIQQDLSLARICLKLQMGQQALFLEILPDAAASRPGRWRIPTSSPDTGEAWLSLHPNRDRSVCR